MSLNREEAVTDPDDYEAVLSPSGMVHGVDGIAPRTLCGVWISREWDGTEWSWHSYRTAVSCSHCRKVAP